jgi:hypothetical protein
LREGITESQNELRSRNPVPAKDYLMMTSGTADTNGCINDIAQVQPPSRPGGPITQPQLLRSSDEKRYKLPRTTHTIFG